jgi:hypothetical protein
MFRIFGFFNVKGSDNASRGSLKTTIPKMSAPSPLIIIITSTLVMNKPPGIFFPALTKITVKQKLMA